MGDPPQLSVVIATVSPWPTLQSCLESLSGQVQELDVELIIVDGHGQALPADTIELPLMHISEIGASVYRLRAIGIKKARGKIVALTEDHCVVSPDWCEQIVSVHGKFPDRDLISGVIENGAIDNNLDWVHFLISKGPFMRPIRQSDSRLIAGEANISFKRHVLPANLSESDVSFSRLLHKNKGSLLCDSVVVWHVQSLGFKETCLIHFHNGKCIAGYGKPSLSRKQLIARMAYCTVLPGILIARTVVTVLRKGRNRLTVAAGFHFLIVFAICHSFGEFLGYLSGPGESPWRMN